MQKMELLKPDCLLLTATITPNVSGVYRADPQTRLNDYLTAIEFYASHTELPIYILENSGYPLDMEVRFKSLAARYSIQVIAIEPQKSNGQGKGYQEFAMLDRGLKLVSGQYKRFMKITGRYLIKNIDEIHAGRFPLLIDIHQTMKVAITSVFVCNIDFYMQHFKNVWKEANDSENRFIEHVIYRKIEELQLWNQVEMFRESPVIEGYPGSYEGSLQRHPVKQRLRNVERKALRLFGKNSFPWEY